MESLVIKKDITYDSIIFLGTLDYSPVQFIHNSVSFDELVALYHLADVCLITSTRDGMNLVAYEYIASQKHKCGVLILSEFAGAAQSLNGKIEMQYNIAGIM
jgi:trehalose-6-phosphate synthase